MLKKKIKISLLRSTNKLFEKRIPIHPVHFNQIDASLRHCLYVEKDYGLHFGYTDSFFEENGIHVKNRAALLASSHCNLIVRPMPTDLQEMKLNASVVGWCHCVQNQEMTKLAMARQLTLICMESFFDDKGHYLLKKNSQITGEQAVFYAVQTLKREDRTQEIAIIGHGSAGMAAIKTFLSMGFKKITCYSRRSIGEIKNVIPGVTYLQIKHSGQGHSISTVMNSQPLLMSLKTADIILNTSAQDIYQPSIFIYTAELTQLKTGTLIMDVSCDRKLGFEFAEITSLSNPVIQHGSVSYCAIDHLPTLDYQHASMNISATLVTLLPLLIQHLEGVPCSLIKRACQITKGKIMNPDINYYRTQILSSLSTQSIV